MELKSADLEVHKHGSSTTIHWLRIVGDKRPKLTQLIDNTSRLVNTTKKHLTTRQHIHSKDLQNYYIQS